MREERKCGTYIPLGLPRGESQSAIASVLWWPIRGSYPDSPSAAYKKSNKLALLTFLLNISDYQIQYGNLKHLKKSTTLRFTICTALIK
jgi:hypothetical protein